MADRPSLTESALHAMPAEAWEVARELAASGAWQRVTVGMGIRPDGMMAEIRRGNGATGSTLPHLGNESTVGALLAMLDKECGSTIEWELGRRGGVYWLALRRDPLVKRWESPRMLGEVVALGLTARATRGGRSRR